MPKVGATQLSARSIFTLESGSSCALAFRRSFKSLAASVAGTLTATADRLLLLERDAELLAPFLQRPWDCRGTRRAAGAPSVRVVRIRFIARDERASREFEQVDKLVSSARRHRV